VRAALFGVDLKGVHDDLEVILKARQGPIKTKTLLKYSLNSRNWAMGYWLVDASHGPVGGLDKQFGLGQLLADERCDKTKPRAKIWQTDPRQSAV